MGDTMEKGKGREMVKVMKGGAKEVHGIRPEWRIEKRKVGADKPYEVLEFKGNVFTNSGINRIWDVLCGASETPFDDANAEIGVGDDDTAESSTQTKLQAEETTVTDFEYVGMDTGYPTHGTDQKVVFRATFGSTQANFTWEEITARNGGGAEGSPINLNRLAQSMGTKTSGTEWIAELTLKIE